MLPDLVHHTEKLFYFFEIAHQGSYQGTARKLGISAPTLSYSMRQLEGVMDVELFHRSQKGVTLTAAGEKLLAFCRRFYRDMEEMQLQIRNRSQTGIERLRVGTFPSIAIYFWPTLMEGLEEDPNLSLSITTDRSREIFESLVKRQIDIALTVEDFNHDNVVKHELYKDQYAFYAAANWKSSQLKADQVINHPILYIPDAIDQDRRTLRQHLYSWGLLFKDEFILDSFEVIGEFVRKGYGVGILPTKVAKIYGDSIKKLKVEGASSMSFGTHRFFLSYRSDLDIPQSLVTSFLTAAKRAVRMQSE